jgi:RHS repeat-associated protein
MGYDASSGLLTSVGFENGASLGYGYNGALLTSLTWSGAITGAVSFTYDSNFRLASENGIALTYDADSLLVGAGALGLTRDPQNGLLTGTTLGAVTHALTYNEFGEALSYSAGFNGAPFYDEEVTRDDAGRITARTETVLGGTSRDTFIYDAAGRLKTVTHNGVLTSYDYDDNGNRVTQTTAGGAQALTYDDQDRMLTRGSASYAYTANGELQSKSDVDGTTTYSYDVTGNLRHVTLADSTAIDYVIDGQNRRVGKKVNGALVGGWLYADQLRIVAQFDGSGASVAQFVYGSRSNVPDYMIRGGATYRIVSDHLGSPRVVVDVASGAIAESIGYDEFGNVTGDTNPGFQPFGFAGGLYDRDTGLVHFGARDYDPQTGRWTSKDPVGFAGGDANVYAYCAGDPVNRIDRSGLDWTDDAMTVLANFSAGFGDGVSRALTFGLWSTANFRQWEDSALGVTSASQCSTAYKVGKYAGYAEGTATIWAAGLNGGSQSVFWSGYNQGARYAAEVAGGTTLEQTVIGGVLDTIQNGFGVRLPAAIWNAAARTFARNAWGEATAVIRAAGPTWTEIEAPILAARDIAIRFIH